MGTELKPTVPRELDEILQFLYGAAPLDGCWYGDGCQPTGKGKYWWRSKLRAAIAALSPSASEPVGEPVAWLYEDTLPAEYPYDAMFSHSQVRGGVRMFPVYASPLPQEPREAALYAELLEALQAAEIGLANAKSYEALPSLEQASVVKALERVRASIARAERELRGAQEVKAPRPCPAAGIRGEHSCANRDQCWEPCGELGKSEEHVRPGRDDEAFRQFQRDRIEAARRHDAEQARPTLNADSRGEKG